MKRLFQILILANLVSVALAQDPQFTQFYAAPLYHNPAFTGSGYAPRLIFNYRNQWPSLNANFITSVVSVDHFIEKANSGIGITMMSDAQGNRIKNSEVTALYAYQLRVGDKNFLRMGLQGSFAVRSFDSNGLIFGDQLSNSGFTNNPSSDPLATAAYRPDRSFDVGSGFLFYNPKVFLGLSVNHITQPTLNFRNNSPADGCATGDCIPRKLVVNGGYNINLSHMITSSGNMDKEFTITPTFLYKKQGQFSQLDLGAYATYTPLTLGLQYRGIPLKKVFDNFPNQDAIAALVGFRFDNFSVGYSYDFTISGLAAGRGTGGSHEFSISYQLDKFDNDKSPYLKQRKKELACPKF
jgi:type IX secretion system PorP/SprF family membrane protein